ncbi:MAG: hypothetical protein AB7F99_06235 [Vicinamibacterales bacterium]
MKNQLGIILGFSELMLGEMESDDPKRRDVEEIHTAALRAMELLSAQAGQKEAGDDD